MAVAFVTSQPFDDGSSPRTSPTFTPTNSGDAILVFAFDLQASVTLGLTGTDGSYTKITPPGDWHDTAHTFTAWVNPASNNVSQTITVSGTVGDFVIQWLMEYSGVSTYSASGSSVSGPGTLSGNAVTVATGDILVAICYETGGGSGSLTSPSGTNRNNGALGVSYCITEYAGSGGSITPTFTAADSGAFDIIQVVLSAAGAAGISTAWWKA